MTLTTREDNLEKITTKLMGEEDIFKLRSTNEEEVDSFLELHQDAYYAHEVYNIINNRFICRSLGIRYEEPTKVDCYVALMYYFYLKENRENNS